MSIQLASTDVLQAVLAAAPATNQLPIHASYVDQGGLGNNLPSVTNGTTAVTFVTSPASGVERLVSQISICNDDTAAATVTVNIVRSSTATRLCNITLQPGYALYYDGGWKVLDTNGNFLCDVTVSSGSSTSNQGTAAAITSPWPVELSNGATAVGTSTAPLRIDPTGTTTQPVNLSELGGAALGVPSNYGTSPGAVAVQGVNAFVTNTLTVNTHAVTQSGTWTVALSAGSAAIGTVGVTSLPSLPAGSNTIGAVTQASGPWTFNLTQVAGTVLATPTAYGTAPSSGNVIPVNANVTNTVSVQDTGSAQHSSTSALTTTSAVNFGSSSTKYLNGFLVLYSGVTAGAATIAFKDGSGNMLVNVITPAASASTSAVIYSVTGLTIPMSNGGSPPTMTLNALPTAGDIWVTPLFT
jgi:hypothetical protein